MFEIATIILSLTAFLAYINHRWIGLPSTIGVMIIAMLLSVLLVLSHTLFGLQIATTTALNFLQEIDFSATLMEGMLSLLLFAGALHVDLSKLRTYKWPILGLAILGTATSTILIGLGTYGILLWLEIPISFWYCMVFGALISPTDPIAVMGVLRQNNAPDSLGIVISGESLFNDGVGVILFTILLGIAIKGNTPEVSSISALILYEVGGGLLLGIVLGGILFYMLRSIDNYSVEVLLTLAGVLGGYLLALRLHTSGPLSMVIMGLFIGNQGRALAMSDITRHHIDLFWELIDEILNAVLFVLLGLEIVLLSLSWKLFMVSLLIIFLTLVVRYITVGLPVRIAKSFLPLPKNAWLVLTWGGLRGGISVALALALPLGTHRDIILAMTYGVVIFSMLGQGLTIGNLIERSISNSKKPQES